MILRRWFAPLPLVAVLPMLFAAGCFDSAGPDELSCTKDKFCPSGYVCVAQQPGAVGKCQKADDSRITDATPAFDGVAGDTAGHFDAALDVRLGLDTMPGPETPSGVDQASPPDKPSEVDAASDMPTQIDGSSDTQPDAPPSAVDSKTDVPPDVPAPVTDTAGACVTAADCPGECQTCSAAHACVVVTNAADPSGHCAGTCDATGTCKAKQGQTCSASRACVAGTLCSADGYCCDKACTGPCEACDSGTGICSPVTGAPHKGHPMCAGTDTACAGTCTGAADGQCTWPQTACGQASCTTTTNAQSQAIGTSFTAAGTCKGGACISPTATSCGGGLICASTTSCKAICTADSDCLTGNICSQGTCTGKKETGLACVSSSECLLGNCVDGYCCDGGCTGTCMACSAAKTGGANGRCLPVSAGTDPDSDCSQDTTNSCGRDGTCDGLGACRVQPVGTACGTSSCANGNFTPAGKCNGSGSCIASTVSSPCSGSLACADTHACATSCTSRSTDGCLAGYKCAGGTSCVPSTLQCGSVAACPVGGGAQCCVTSGASYGSSVFTCQAAGASCASTSVIPCNSRAECPASQVCCLHGNGVVPGSWTAVCESPSSCVGSPGYGATQVCDPSLTAPSECLSGTCHDSSDPSALPGSGLGICY
jgi:hypothetical protein